MNLVDSIAHSKKILAKNTEHGHCLFVPKEIMFEYVAILLQRDLDFQRYLEIQEISDISNLDNAISNA
mgnify:CR=1 FL=1